MLRCGIVVLKELGGGLDVREELGCGMAVPREPTLAERFVILSLSSS
jgi:hypothetical protein